MLTAALTLSKTENSLSRSLLTRYHNYNSIKNHIAGMYSTLHIQRVESSRSIGEHLGINKSTVARVLIQLEDDGFISKVRTGIYPKNNWYLVRLSNQECFLFRNYYGLSPFKKNKFLKNLETCGAKSLDEIVKIHFGMGYEYYTESKVIGQ